MGNEPFEPNRTQRVRIELERIGDTDHHRTNELLLHIIEQNEVAIENLQIAHDRLVDQVNRNFDLLSEKLISEEAVKNWILGAFAADAHRRDLAAKGRYFAMVLKYVIPAALGSGSLIGAFVHHYWTTKR
jgi:hypothetical protein